MAPSCPVWWGSFGGIVVSVAPSSVVRYHPKDSTKTLCPVQGRKRMIGCLLCSAMRTGRLTRNQACTPANQRIQKPGVLLSSWLHTLDLKHPGVSVVSSLWKLHRTAQRRAKQISKGLYPVLALPLRGLDNLMALSLPLSILSNRSVCPDSYTKSLRKPNGDQLGRSLKLHLLKSSLV